jgi:hypothetical protein
MILYHGTPISGGKDDARQFLAGRHALISYAYPDHLEVAKGVAETFVLDNGAFTAWKQGKNVCFDSYTRWVELHSKHFRYNWCLIPDVIDGTEKTNTQLIDEFPVELCGVPIWHLHETFDKLEWLSHQYHTVALGSSGTYSNPGSVRWWDRMTEAMSVVCDDGAPRCKLHGLRMADPAIFTRLPLSSADSTNCAQNGPRKAKQIKVPETWQGCTVIAWQLEQYDSPKTWCGSPANHSFDLVEQT